MAKSAGDAIANVGRDIAPENYRPATADFFRPREADKGIGGYGWGYVPRMILEGAPGLAMDIAAGAATGGAGFLASNAARSFGPAMDARVENNGGRAASASDYVMATGSSALQAYANKLGLNPALTGVAKGAGIGAVAQIPGQVAKAGAVDAASGAAGAVVDQIGVTAGTDKGLTIDPHEAIGSAVASGATGGAIRTLRGVGDVTNAIRFADIDPEVAGRLATRIDRLGVALDSPEQAYKAVKIADEALSAATSRARRDYGMSAGQKGTEANTERMDSAEAMLRNGYALAPSHLAELRDALGGHRLGRRYVETLEERSALNQVKDTGRFEDGYFAGGFSSSPLVDDMINPASWLRNPTKRAIGGIGAALGFGTELEAIRAVAAPAALAKALAVQGAAYGGIRAIDGITGSRNPLKELTSRFAGDASSRSSPVTDAPLMTRTLSDLEEARVQEAISRAVAPLRKATESAGEAQGQPLVGKGSSEDANAASESPRGSAERIALQTIRIESGPYVVERPREGIANVKAYAAKTRSHMETRAQFGSDLEAVVGPQHTREIEGLINKINNQARSADEAASFVEDAITALPWDKQSQAWDAYLKHEHKIASTFRR
ncbi:hypothetical protein [Bosea sp. CS1GBMeth4]|uniref:hypothetical protein n=1 Tax=Bosea sp. CS1GBMeth4 TaxID=1892849 RepID=UPI001647131E|nr:hypothetical protein [Bosea sp. CS1GBMeth4]